MLVPRAVVGPRALDYLLLGDSAYKKEGTLILYHSEPEIST
jgi:hypothetical protein